MPKDCRTERGTLTRLLCQQSKFREPISHFPLQRCCLVARHPPTIHGRRNLTRGHLQTHITVLYQNQKASRAAELQRLLTLKCSLLRLPLAFSTMRIVLEEGTKAQDSSSSVCPGKKQMSGPLARHTPSWIPAWRDACFLK